MKLLFALSAATLATSTANAAYWVNLGTTSDSTVTVDLESADQQGDVRTAWVKFENHKVAKDGEKSSKQLVSINCIAQQMRLDHWMNYRADGTVLDSKKSYIQNEFEPIAPETVSEVIAKFVCGLGQ